MKSARSGQTKQLYEIKQLELMLLELKLQNY